MGKSATMQNMEIEITEIYTGTLFVKTYCFPLDADTIAIVDPGGADDELLDYVKAKKAKNVSIMITHGHFDHVGGIAGLLQIYPDAKVYIHHDDRAYLGETGIAEHIKCFAPIHLDRYITQYEKEYKTFPPPTDIINDGDMVNGFKVIHTPGHTPGSVCFYHEAAGILFAGDTLFYHTFGRTDLYGSSESALKHSLRRLIDLPDETKVYPGHGRDTVMGEEKAGIKAATAES